MAIRGPIQDIGRQTAIYGVGNVLSKIAVFFLIPVYTRFLVTSEVGILALLEMVEQFLITIAPMGVINAVWRYLPDSNDRDREKIIISAYLCTLIVNVFILILMGANFKSIGIFFGLDESNATMLLVVFMNIFLALGIRFMLSLWQYNRQPLPYIILSLIQFVGVVLFTILFVVFKGWGLWGVLLAKSLVFGLIFIYSGFVIFRKYWSLPSISVYFKLLKYGFPLILLAIVTPILTVSDRFFLNLFVTLDDIGIYSISYKFGMLINIFIVIPLQRGWGPMMYRLGVEEKSHEFYRDIMFYYAVIGSLIFLLTSFFIDDILRVIATPEYLTGAFIIPIVTFAYFINGFRIFFAAGAALKDKTPRLALAAFIAICTNLFLNYLFIKSYGMIGAAWATFLSYTVLTLTIYIASQRLVRINWAWPRLIKLISITLIIFILISQFQSQYKELSIVLGLVGIILFVILIVITGIIGNREINGIKSILSSIK